MDAIIHYRRSLAPEVEIMSGPNVEEEAIHFIYWGEEDGLISAVGVEFSDGRIYVRLYDNTWHEGRLGSDGMAIPTALTWTAYEAYEFERGAIEAARQARNKTKPTPARVSLHNPFAITESRPSVLAADIDSDWLRSKVVE